MAGKKKKPEGEHRFKPKKAPARRNIPVAPAALNVIPVEAKTSLRFFQSKLLARADTDLKIMVVGAIANAFYGRARYSRDVDVAVALGDEKSKEALFTVMKDVPRYSIVYPDRKIDRGDPALDSPSDLDKLNLVKLKDKEVGISLDILLVGRNEFYGLDRSSFARAKSVELAEGWTAPIVAPEDFILMKLAARRPQSQDFQDMFMVMTRNYSSLDWPYLYHRAKELNLTALLDSYKGRAAQATKRNGEKEI